MDVAIASVCMVNSTAFHSTELISSNNSTDQECESKKSNILDDYTVCDENVTVYLRELRRLLCRVIFFGQARIWEWYTQLSFGVHLLQQFPRDGLPIGEKRLTVIFLLMSSNLD